MLLRFSPLFSTGGAPAVDPVSPAVFGGSAWSLIAEGEVITIVITNVPADGGSPITAIQYRRNGGEPIDLGATGPGTFPTVAQLGESVEIRAVNAVDPGPWSAPKVIAAVAPTISAAHSLAGRTLIVTVTASTGSPVPTFAIAMTANGAAVTPTLVSSGVWTYTAPDSGAATTLAWTVTAANGVTPNATASGSQSVPANLSAPTGTLNLDRIGRTVTAWISAPTGSPVPTAALTLFDAAGVNVLGSVAGAGTQASPWSYTAPGTDEVVVDVAVSLSNGVSPDWSATGQRTVPAAGVSFSLAATADGEIEADGATGEVTVTITSPSIYAGTYTFASNDLTLGPLNLVPPRLVDDGSPGVGETLTIIPGLWVYNPDAGGLAGPTYQWQANGNDIGGATGATFTVTEAQQGTQIRVRETLLDAGGARTASSTTVAIPAPPVVARPLLVFEDSTIVGGGAGTPHTHTYDTSAMQAGDRLFVILRNSSTRDLAELATIDGSAAFQMPDQSAETNNEWRHFRLYEFVMPGAGKASFPLVVSRAAGSNARTALTLFGVRGGLYARRAWQFLEFATNVNASNLIAPAVDENLLLSVLSLAGDPGAVSWTGATAGHTADNTLSNPLAIRAAQRLDANAGNITISASWPTGRRGGLLTLSIEAEE